MLASPCTTPTWRAVCSWWRASSRYLQQSRPIYDPDIFKSKRVTDYLNTINEAVKAAIESALTKFGQPHTPLSATETMDEWISRAPDIFGPLWCLLCNMRGVKPTHMQERERQMTIFTQ